MNIGGVDFDKEKLDSSSFKKTNCYEQLMEVFETEQLFIREFVSKFPKYTTIDYEAVKRFLTENHVLDEKTERRQYIGLTRTIDKSVTDLEAAILRTNYNGLLWLLDKLIKAFGEKWICGVDIDSFQIVELPLTDPGEAYKVLIMCNVYSVYTLEELREFENQAIKKTKTDEPNNA